jgi:import inner membrane translocase subunit TIM50
MFGVKDVRPIISAYRGKDIPVEYAKKEAEAKQKVLEDWERTHAASGAGSGSSWVGSLFGAVSPVRTIRPNL